MEFVKALFKVLLSLASLIMIFSSPNCALGKHLVFAEYFIDTDPGLGKGTSIDPCDVDFDETEAEFCVNGISVPDLSDGRHVFYLRLKDSENQWGRRQLDFYIVSSSPYVSKTITDAEYFINTDPGEGNGTMLSAADGGFDESVEYLLAGGIESSSLPLGPCSLFVRVKDSYNVWSVPRRVNFNVIEASPYKILDTAEYFIDTDPGAGQGIALTADDGSFDESTEDVHKDYNSTDSLSLGNHLVYVRFKDNWSYWPTFNGWGPSEVDTLCVCKRAFLVYPLNGSCGPPDQTFQWTFLDSVVSYQLQIDTDSLFPNPIKDTTLMNETCYVTGLPGGIPLWWRVRGNYPCEGVWSNIFEYTDVKDGEEKKDLPSRFFLSHNYPNPFNPDTQIEFDLPKDCHVGITVYNVLGQKVKTLVRGFQVAGHKIVHWDGTDKNGSEVASGIYFYRLDAAEYAETKKMILMR